MNVILHDIDTSRHSISYKAFRLLHDMQLLYIRRHAHSTHTKDVKLTTWHALDVIMHKVMQDYAFARSTLSLGEYILHICKCHASLQEYKQTNKTTRTTK